MSKREETDLIFDQIIERYKQNGITITSPIRDGIINEAKFEAQKVKVLFICKEHNQLNDTYKEGDARDWMNENVNYSFSKTLARWSYGLLNDFPPFTEVEQGNNLLEALQCVAMINVKKISGGNSTSNKSFDPFFEMGKDLVAKQIEIIKPNVIISSLGWHGYIDKLLGCSTEQNEHGLYSCEHNGIKVIDFIHPSSRGNQAAMYYYLKMGL